MSAVSVWAGRLEAEITRELGQAVTLTAGGTAPEPGQSQLDVLTLPEARLVLASDRSEVAGLLAEARVIEAGAADAETVRELWSGILASVAAGLGGNASSSAGSEAGGDPWVLRLGKASLRISLAVAATQEAVGSETGSSRQNAPRPAPAAPLPPAAGHAAGNFDLLLEVELDAAVRFGSREMELRDLLELGPGDVVELDRQVADPVDLIVGDRIVARGEVVLVNGNFGLRVTEVAEPVRRLETIRCLW